MNNSDVDRILKLIEDASIEELEAKRISITADDSISQEEWLRTDSVLQEMIELKKVKRDKNV